MMAPRDALQVLADHRGDRVVVTTMSAAGVWPALSDTPLDFTYLPSSMGQAPSLGLGIALAQSRHGVIVVNGDGCTLMNLGCLATLAHHPAPLWLIVFDNGHYEVTGGQPTAGSGHVDFAAVARAVGLNRAYHFTDATSWREGAAQALAPPGPVLIWLQVEGRTGQATPAPPRSMTEQLTRLRGALLC